MPKGPGGSGWETLWGYPVPTGATQGLGDAGVGDAVGSTAGGIIDEAVVDPAATYVDPGLGSLEGPSKALAER